RARAAALGASPSAAELATRAGAGATLIDEELAALLLSPHVSTEALLAIAAARRPAGRPHLETFSPLYLTNECHAECLMCGMSRRRDGRVVPRVTMCTFQETYSPAAYARFIGTDPGNPRSDFARRLTNFDRACDAGMWVANPGVLLGLNPDVAYELLALVAHVRHLRRRGMEVYVSLPRLRKASGTPYAAGVSDDLLCRLVAVLSLGLREAKVVISTREPPAMQRRLLPVIGVLTPGSPGVAPYTETGARFELEASQFEVLDHRPIEAILGEILAAGATIDCYEPARGA